MFRVELIIEIENAIIVNHSKDAVLPRLKWEVQIKVWDQSQCQQNEVLG